MVAPLVGQVDIHCRTFTKSGCTQRRCAAKGCRNNGAQEIAHLIIKPCAGRGARMYCYEIRTDHRSGSRLPERPKRPHFRVIN